MEEKKGIFKKNKAYIYLGIAFLGAAGSIATIYGSCKHEPPTYSSNQAISTTNNNSPTTSFTQSNTGGTNFQGQGYTVNIIGPKGEEHPKYNTVNPNTINAKNVFVGSVSGGNVHVGDNITSEIHLKDSDYNAIMGIVKSYELLYNKGRKYDTLYILLMVNGNSTYYNDICALLSKYNYTLLNGQNGDIQPRNNSTGNTMGEQINKYVVRHANGVPLGGYVDIRVGN